MRLKNLDLIVAMLVVVINVVVLQIPGRPLAIGVILALPLILILPGYMLTQALFGRKKPTPLATANLIRRPSLKIGQPINVADHVILSLGLSMAIDVVVGFALNILPIGLRALSWTLALGLLTTVFALLVVFLRRKETAQAKKNVRPRFTVPEYTFLGLAILVTGGALWLSGIRPPNPQPSFTQFWLLPAANNSCQVQVGVQSFEATAESYRIVVTSNSTNVSTWSSVVLAPQQKWGQAIIVKPGASALNYIEAVLYRADNPQVIYREVHVTLNSPTGSAAGKVSC